MKAKVPEGRSPSWVHKLVTREMLDDLRVKPGTPFGLRAIYYHFTPLPTYHRAKVLLSQSVRAGFEFMDAITCP